MADNLDSGLDADILQCRQDIQRILQSMLDSGTDEAGEQEPQPEDTTAALIARSMETSQPAEPEATVEKAEDKTSEEYPYAVTRQEVEALLNDDDDEVVDQPGTHERLDAESEPAVSEQFDAIFDDDVVAAPVEEAEAEPLEVPALFEDKPAPEFADAVVEDAAEEVVPVVQADEPIETIPAAEAGSVLTEEELPVKAQAPDEEPKPEDIAPAETEVVPMMEESEAETWPDEEIRTVSPEENSREQELDEIVAEAEEWMAQIAPGNDEEVAATEAPPAEPEPEPLAAPAEPVAEVPVFDARQTQPDHHFDEVVSKLQGEEAIIPVEEDHAEIEQPQEQAAAEDKPAEAEVDAAAEEQQDVKLRIIQDMKDKGLRSDEDRGGVPRLDLSESALAGIAESRKTAAATRKGPGRKDKPETIEAEADVAETAPEPAQPEAISQPQAGEERIEAVPAQARSEAGPMERMRREKERQIIAGIVARDIEKFCAGRTERRQERARQP